ncbi:MAG TPA: VWA domain-containing protein [Vicinamibacterales bacterium]|nr:VWA domain-containing protein [Vicinamibacterales bacterium]
MEAIRFGAPQYLPLLAVPGVLLLLWLRLAWKRRGDVAALRRRRLLPVRERIPYFGELLFWLCLLLALGVAIAAVARPRTATAIIRTAGVDFVVLQDGSASMHVGDVGGRGSNRWQRSVRFLRALGESLRWEDDRVALALFAHIATPQVRLTKDPNTYFFFLDHLDAGSPFRLEDDASWDTNIERGIYWGLRLFEKDEELQGPSTNAKAFILVSDGQAWSGEVAKSIGLAQARGIPVHVVGVGTTAGGVIPDPKRDATQAAIRSVLDRSSLSTIATAGGGRYFELDRDPDRDIANALIDMTRRRAGGQGVQEAFDERYREFLMVAAGLLVLGVLFLRDQAALALQLAAGVGALLFVARLF